MHAPSTFAMRPNSRVHMGRASPYRPLHIGLSRADTELSRAMFSPRTYSGDVAVAYRCCAITQRPPALASDASLSHPARTPARRATPSGWYIMAGFSASHRATLYRAARLGTSSSAALSAAPDLDDLITRQPLPTTWPSEVRRVCHGPVAASRLRTYLLLGAYALSRAHHRQEQLCLPRMIALIRWAIHRVRFRGLSQRLVQARTLIAQIVCPPCPWYLSTPMW